MKSRYRRRGITLVHTGEGKRKKFLATFAMLGILMSAGLAWVHAGM